MKKALPYKVLAAIGALVFHFSYTLSAQTTVTITAGQNWTDALIYQDQKAGRTTQNYSTYTRINASAWSNTQNTFTRSLIKVNLSNIPVGTPIQNAILYLYSEPTIESEQLSNNQINGSNAVYFERILASWNETAVTWANQPTTSTTDRILLGPSPSVSQNENVTVNITSFVQSWINNPTANNGMMMKLVTESKYRARNYASEDHTTPSVWPKLVITYASQTVTVNATANPASVCEGGTSILTATGSPSNTYRWFVNNNEILGKTGPELVAEGLTQSKTYSVEATGTNISSNKVTLNLIINPPPQIIASLSSNEIKTGNNLNLSINGTVGNSYNINWGDGETQAIGTATSASHAYKDKGNYKILITTTSTNNCSAVTEKDVLVYSILWSGNFPALSGANKNLRNGSYILLDPCGQEHPLACFSALDYSLANVVQSSYEALNYPAIPGADINTSNPYQDGQRVLRPIASYQYNNGQATAPGENNTAGTFNAIPFNWLSGIDMHPANWLPNNKARFFSADGDVLEEENILGVKSSAKFGYGNESGNGKALPYLIAQNASSTSVLFESFEKSYIISSNTFFEDGLPLSNDITSVLGIAHAGKGCLKLNISNGTGRFITKQFDKIDFKDEVLVKVWVKIGLPAKSKQQLPFEAFQVQLMDINGIILAKPTFNLEPIAQTGEWILLEGIISLTSIKGKFTPVLKYAGTETMVFLDDLRIQPAHAQLTGYVYDEKTLRLLTSFDDQHFGLYYQYNEEGKLIRKQIETERGLKTIQETQYNLPTVLR